MLALMLLLAGFIQVAAPFGVAMGSSVSSYSPKKGATEFTFNVQVPKPHTEFEAYTVVTTPQTGICKVWGVGRNHDNDRSGESVKSSYESLFEALTDKYGQAKSFDFLKSGALWDAQSEWVMAIRQNERHKIAFWSTENGSRLPPEISSISLEVKALDSSTAYLDLTYEFSNFVRCKSIISAKRSDSL